jgi:hypothetical protein
MFRRLDDALAERLGSCLSSFEGEVDAIADTRFRDRIRLDDSEVRRRPSDRREVLSCVLDLLVRHRFGNIHHEEGVRLSRL